jgi:hypothetical protein
MCVFLVRLYLHIILKYVRLLSSLFTYFQKHERSLDPPFHFYKEIHLHMKKIIKPVSQV